MANRLTLTISAAPSSPVKASVTDKITVINNDHANMQNLDYEHSGHTGFVPARLSILPTLDPDTVDESKARLFVDYNGESKSMLLEDVKGSQVHTVTEIPANAKAGEYYFKEVN